MSKYRKLKKMIKDCGWTDLEEYIYADIGYFLLINAITDDLIEEYGIDEVLEVTSGNADEEVEEVYEVELGGSTK